MIHAVPFTAKINWGEIHPTTGKVTVKNQPEKEWKLICPAAPGGKEWVHASYSPLTKLLYVPVLDICAEYRLVHQEFKEGLSYLGGDYNALGHVYGGYLKAIDPATGVEVWSWKNDQPMLASVLTTAGDLVFTGEPTGEFDAFDARSGELLWQFQTGSGIHSSPVTYSVKGKQYVAVPTGWGGWIPGFAPNLTGGSRGAALFVFALP